ncbi:PREDICTED: probable ATP-dependent RNA helicase DDX28 [Branchiostoma belcheri]|uniref:RNA helicase n=1 Tax=Branchiostoma belcheri TaxID=7741 RepID=A0A6P4ZIX9_BRABE|nr:PREDICTED: probable ATP-dependent RNA helicase DDX28 [Branchiostoma belcheri]
MAAPIEICRFCRLARFGFLVRSIGSRSTIDSDKCTVQYGDSININTQLSRYYVSEAARQNVIRIPQYLNRRLDQIKKAKSLGKNSVPLARPGRIIISCKRKEFNHYGGQSLGKFDIPTLASQGWKHKKSVGDHFTIVGYTKNPALLPEEKDTDKEKVVAGEGGDRPLTTFGGLPLEEGILEGLRSMKMAVPTKIQAAAIPAILSGKNVLCAAETGSGKTLCYVVPLLQSLLPVVREPDTDMARRELGRPLAVIVVPARELAEQVMKVLTSFNTAMLKPFQMQMVVGGQGIGNIKKKLEKCVDILVITPGALNKALHKGFLGMDWAQCLVLDEIDTLLDDSFSELTLEAISCCQVRVSEVGGVGDGTQVIMAGATMPKRTAEVLGEVVPMESLVTVTTPALHRVMPHVSQKFLRVKSSSKAATVLELVKQDVNEGCPVIVFCNTFSSADWLSHTLRENNIKHSKITGKLSATVRLGIFKEFQDGLTDVLVCTDIASRGLDTVRVQHVINFDFPGVVSDYIHRVGRVGRVGSRVTGKVTSLVCQPYEVDMLWKIETAVRRQTELKGVDANITRKIAKRFMDEWDFPED